ncbi:MAG: hypothetical protein OXU20_25345 [Myxococcales bacterium]|nr:hypothetical protein [Myxococcales bacterium]MDD9966745.1 hypothetical protein [Myxococcales bacterium]
MNETTTNKTTSIATDERGAGMVEYIILAGVVALLSLVAFTDFGGSVQTKIGQHGSAVGKIRSELTTQ